MSELLVWPDKDPTDVLDYSINWSGRLSGDTILTSSFDVPAGLTKDAETNTNETSTLWLSGGTAGISYTITCTVTTAAGRTWQESVRIVVREK